MNLFAKSTLISLLVTLLLSEVTLSQQHGWRGPQRNGHYPETGLLKQWPAEGPELLWEITDAGKGYSSPLIVDDRIYLTGMNSDGTREILNVFDLHGQRIYVTEYGSPWDNTYPETRTTPTIVDGKAYVISGSGDIVCINTSDGAIVWKVDGDSIFERKPGRWGTSESPLVFDNKIIYTPGGDKTAMVALDTQSGETLWATRPLGEAGSYVSPLLISHKGTTQIIGILSKTVFGVDPDNGNIVWTFNDWGSQEGEFGNIATNTPLYDNGRIFYSFGYNIGSYMLELNDDASAVTLAWKNDAFDTHIGGYVLADNIIYGSNWANNSQGNWIAIDWNTGETRFEDTWTGKSKGAVITADNMLICYEERRGTVALVKANPEKFDVVSEFLITQGDGPYWAHPVINKGILYIRHGNALMAYKISG